MSTVSSLLAPLRLEAVPKATLWGGRNLETLVGKTLPPAALIGETWETATESVVADGPLGGETIGALVERHGKELLGWRAIEVLGNRFPLLAKFIDAQQWLSVQVHPDDAYAAAYEHGKLGKTETWYILHAEPGAQIVYGLSREATQDEVAAAIAANTLESLLATRTVEAGDVVFVPAGTVHAIGAGVVLYELQQYSDITYRLYDYGRLQADGTPRELHVAQALAVMHYGPRDVRVHPAPLDDRTLPGGARRVLSASRYFVLEELTLEGIWTSETTGASCEIVTLLEGECEFATPNATVRARKGETVVLPATLGHYTLGGAARLVRSYVPTEGEPGLRAWHAAQGHGPSATGR